MYAYGICMYIYICICTYQLQNFDRIPRTPAYFLGRTFRARRHSYCSSVANSTFFGRSYCSFALFRHSYCRFTARPSFLLQLCNKNARISTKSFLLQFCSKNLRRSHSYCISVTKTNEFRRTNCDERTSTNKLRQTNFDGPASTDELRRTNCDERAPTNDIRRMNFDEQT